MQVPLELGLVVLAGAHPAEDPGDADGRDEVHQPDEQQERAGDDRADQREGLRRPAESSSWTTSATERTPATSSRLATKTTDEWPRENQKPGADRRLALADELAGGVVDRGDVVGVEGVPDAEHVGGQADADAEDAGAAEPVVVRGDREDQHAPADDVQQQDEAGHAGDRPPVPRREEPPVAAGGAAPPGSCRHGRRPYCELFATSLSGRRAPVPHHCGLSLLQLGPRTDRSERGAPRRPGRRTGGRGARRGGCSWHRCPRRVRTSWRRWVAVVLAFNIALGMGFSVVALRHQADARSRADVLFAELDAAASAQDALLWRAADRAPRPGRSLAAAGQRGRRRGRAGWPRRRTAPTTPRSPPR